MTILFSYTSDKQAAVASDGNIVRNSNDMIVADDKDKTFYLFDKMIVGAFSNNMSLDHNFYGINVDIGTIIANISKDIKLPISFNKFVDNLIITYQNILNSEETLGPSMINRKSNILLAGSKHFDGKQFEIYCLRFTFKDTENRVSLLKKEGPFSGNGAWYVDPPDEERQSIFKSIQQDFNNLPQGLTINKIARRGIGIGISTSKIEKANGKFLGGKISIKLTPL